MFLTERLIGILTYVTFLFISIYLISRAQRRRLGFLLLMYLIGISIMAFLYVPAVEADLYRLLGYMSDRASLSGADFSIALAESTIPATLIYLRAIGTIGVDGLLAGITTLIVFGNIFYIIYDYSKREKLSNKAVAWVLLTVMSTGIYMQTLGGIRTMLAFSIVAKF